MKGVSAWIHENKWLMGIMFLGLIIRLVDINQPFIGLSGWNEAHYSLAPLNYFKYGVFTPMNDYGLDLSTTPFLYWAIYASFKVFGVHEWSARLPNLLTGLTSIWIIFSIASHLYDRETAYYSAFIASIAPGIVYFSRSVQLESMMALASLTAILALIRYRETTQTSWYWLSIFSLGTAIFIKLPAILIYPVLAWIWFESFSYSKSREGLIKLSNYFVLPLIPSLFWVYYGFRTTPLFMRTYFIRTGDSSNLVAIIDALEKSFSQFIPWNIGILQFFLLLFGIPIILSNLKKHLPMILLSTTWLLLVFKYPATYINNWYYDYTGLYGMAVLAGFIIARSIRFMIEKQAFLRSKAIISIFITVTIIVNMQGYYDPFHKYFDTARDEFVQVGEKEPFYSAKYIANLNEKEASVLVDWPSTMFYAGGDPEHIKAMHFNDQQLLDALEKQSYTYIILYYQLSNRVMETLNNSGYVRIAPRGWIRK